MSRAVGEPGTIQAISSPDHAVETAFELLIHNESRANLPIVTYRLRIALICSTVAKHRAFSLHEQMARSSYVSDFARKCHDLECQGTGVVECKLCTSIWGTDKFSKEEICLGCAGTRRGECQICDGTGKLPLGDVLLDGTTLVQASALINNGELNPANLHCLSLLLQSIVLNQRMVFVEPVGEVAYKILHSELRMLPSELVKIVRLPYAWVSWDRLHDVPELAPTDDKGNALSLTPELCKLRDPRHDLARDAALLYEYVKNQRGWRRKKLASGDAVGREWLRDAIVLDSPYPSIFIREPDARVLQAITSFRSALYFRLMHYLNIPYRPEFYRVKIFRNALKEVNSRFGMLTLQIATQIDQSVDAYREMIGKLLPYSNNRIKLPIIAAIILKNAGKAENIISTALEMRNSTEAVAFRKAAQRVELVSSIGEDPSDAMDFLSQAAQKIDAVKSESNIRLEISMFPSVAYSLKDGFTGGSLNLSGIPITIARALINKFRQRNIVFLDTLVKKSNEIWNMNSVLRSVFKKELSEQSQIELTEALSVSR